MLHRDAVTHLVSSFTEEDIIYVTGKLVYINQDEAMSSKAESDYWNYDLFMRKVESDVRTITAGNGALYAIRKAEYVFFDPIRCHDAAMPSYAALNHKRALFNEKAIAYERAGATSSDEFRRKVRMFREVCDHSMRMPASTTRFAMDGTVTSTSATGPAGELCSSFTS